MLAKTGESITVGVFYTSAGVGKTGLTVTVDIYRDGVSLLTAQAASETGGGMYRYTLTGGNTGNAGFYAFIFKTTDTTVDRQQWGDAWIVQQAWLANIDATISSRLADASKPANFGSMAIDSNGKVTPNTQIITGTASAGSATTITLAGASATDNLYTGETVFIASGTGAGQARVISSYVGSTKVATVSQSWTVNPDATSVFIVTAIGRSQVDSNLDKSAYSLAADQAVNVTKWAGSAVNALISGRVDATIGAVQNGVIAAASFAANALDAVWSTAARTLTAFGFNVTVSTNNDKTGYTLTSGEHTSIATDTQIGLTAQGYTTTRAGYLDTLNNLVANIWSWGARTLTSVINAVVVSPVNPTNATITITTATDYNLIDYDRAISLTASTWPDLTAGTVQFLVSTQGGGAYTAYGSVTITNPGGGGASQTVNIILTNAQNNFVPAQYSYQLLATLSSGRKAELASGTLVVNP